MKLGGLVLAAGVGSRLGPLTRHTPKPMMPLLDRPLIDHAITRLAAAGAREVFVNAHHGARVLERHLESAGQPVPVRVRREAALTGPAGALRLFASELAAYDAVLVVSGDAVVGDELGRLADHHAAGGAAMTFGAVPRRIARRFGVLTVDGQDRVLGCREKPDLPDHEEHLVSAGVYCLDPAVVHHLRGTGPWDYAADLAPALLARRQPVLAYRMSGYWRDIGTPRALHRANMDALEGHLPWLADRTRPGPAEIAPDARIEGPVMLGAGCRIAAGATVRGPAVLGEGCEVGEGAWLQDTLVLPGTRVAPGGYVVGGIAGGLSGTGREATP
ncbi:sugar phosphate nucleotidyltransferase [Streptomyces koyangensis]|uniref:sugar phosphate nucleotidyltransferase n=1 Tax=Streptomyces koyangensis TaxID=188770 RepID=UPI003C2D9756